KYAEEKDGVPTGFATPTRKVELYSETFLAHGYAPLPEFEEPLVSPLSRPDLAARYPLILTSSKNTQFCESQHRALPSLPHRAPPPGGSVPRGPRPPARPPPGAVGDGPARGGPPSPPGPASTKACIRASSAASTAGGRPAPKSAPPPTTPSARTAPTST